jgi:hypothetical protein
MYGNTMNTEPAALGVPIGEISMNLRTDSIWSHTGLDHDIQDRDNVWMVEGFEDFDLP